MYNGVVKQCLLGKDLGYTPLCKCGLGMLVSKHVNMIRSYSKRLIDLFTKRYFTTAYKLKWLSVLYASTDLLVPASISTTTCYADVIIQL